MRSGLTVFVTDGNERPALAITRSLGRAGYVVVVGSDRAKSLAGSSRHCADRVVYPSPHADPNGFRDFLLAFAAARRAHVILPVTDVTTRVVAAEQRTLAAHVATVVPPLDAFEMASDKARLLQHAERAGLPAPHTVSVEHRAHLLRIADSIEYPAVVKPFRSRIPTAGGWIGTTVHYAASRADLERLYEHHEYLAAHPSLIQTRIVGPGVGLFALFDRGRLLTAFAHRRLREKPPSGGVSVLRESVAPNQRLVDYANRLLAPLGWHGVAMVEFKIDARTAQPFLMEVNGRFWGSLQLAIDAGVDFPRLACDLALGRPLDLPARYRVGVKNRWLFGDLDHLLLRLFKRARDLRLPADAPSRLRALAAFAMDFGRGMHYETAQRDDVRPFLHEAAEYAASFVRSAGRHERHQTSTVAQPPPLTNPGGSPQC